MSGSAQEHTLATYLQKCETDAAAQILAGMHIAEPQIVEIGGIPHLVTPAGSDITDFAELMDRPKQLRASAKFTEPKSFCEYVRQFNGENTARIYADYKERRFVAQLDDHQPGAPTWRGHTATLQLEHSPEWEDWFRSVTQSKQQPLDQQELAEFFESHIRQIAEPDAADLLSGIRNVQMSSNWKCTSVQREGGDIAFTQQREDTASTSTPAKAEGKIPARLTLMILPYTCWHGYPLKVMLTYRLRDGKISFTMKMLEVNEFLDTAFFDIRQYIEEETKLQVLL